MYFKEAEDEFKKILDEEGIILTDSFRHYFLEIMSEMCNYSEEDHRIRPQVILGVNLRSYFETITPKSYIIMCVDTLDGEKLLRYFKSLALFCDNGWYIVVNVNEERVEYGIFRRYTNIDGEKFEDYFKESFDSITDGHMLILKAINNLDIEITRCKRDEFIISQRFAESVVDDDKSYENIFVKMADDIIAGCSLDEKEYVKKCLLKIFRNFPLKIHGTIMLVVDDAFELPQKSLTGIRISPPINFNDVFIQYKEIGRYSEAENVYSLIGVLYEMLNTDGITIITNRARVLYYNVFYEGAILKDIKGGARKRTATGILMNKSLNGIIGVYFQSQDGDAFYKRRIIDE